MNITKLRRLGGIHPAHAKSTENAQSVHMPIPARVVITMQQHMGAPCKPAVAVGDAVQVGQLIGECTGGFCVPIHSSVSGTVKGTQQLLTASGAMCDAVVIETDGKQEVCRTVVPPVVNSKESFIEAVKASGLVGLGGAGFPTWVKLNLRPDQKADCLIINAAECEPYITADYREMIENAGNVITGMLAVKKWLGIDKVYVSIEKNKPKAIELFRKLGGSTNDFTVFSLESKYPKGAEKVIIYDTVGRTVPEGKLPADVGVIVMNVTTAGFLGSYLTNGMPLTTKRITVDGASINKPQNLIVPLGVSIADVAEFCGGLKDEPGKILMGGPMMGFAVADSNTPVIKNNNAVLFFSEAQTKLQKTTACIRCGRCVFTCPMRLSPVTLERAYEARDCERLARFKVNLCIECGCCSYTCPAKRPLVQAHRASKKLLKEIKR